MLGKLKQFKDLRDQGKQLQSALSGQSATVTALGGLFSLTMNGNMGIESVSIDPGLLTPEKKVKLEGAFKDAHSDALKKIQKIIATKMQESGMKLPGLN